MLRIKTNFFQKVDQSWSKMDYSKSHSKPPSKQWVINEYFLYLGIFIETELNTSGNFSCQKRRNNPFTLKEVMELRDCFCGKSVQFSSFQLLRRVWLFATPWTAACQASLSITNSWSPPKLMSIELLMPFNHLILWHPVLLPPSIFPSIRVFSNESVLCIRRPKYWSFSFNMSPSIEHPGLISFRMDWLDFLAVQGTLKSLLQHHSSKASILRLSTFFIVQLSHPYMTTGKNIALTFVAVTICSDLGAPKYKVSHCFPSYLPWNDGTGCHDLTFLSVGVLHHVFHSPLSLSPRGSSVLLNFLT